MADYRKKYKTKTDHQDPFFTETDNIIFISGFKLSAKMQVWLIISKPVRIISTRLNPNVILCNECIINI
jgi:hypothetical protein